MLRCRLLCVDSPGALPPRSISLSSSVLRLPTHTNTHTDAYAVPLSPLLSCAQGIALCIMVKSHYICAGRL
ncbi:40S ribosomal protein L14, putative, partial [Leishmania donovani]